MENVPESLCFYTETLSRAVRSSDITTTRIANYQTFVREHIVEVIEQTFPQFNRHITPAAKAQYADEFICLHKATEPEFHHIATEFVQFIQQKSLSQPYLLNLLEYEWVLFSVSILPVRVHSQQLILTAEELTKNNPFIELNPTLYCIELPFSIEKIESGVIDINANKNFVYGIFRNAEHNVLYKPLNLHERYLIQLLEESPLITFNTLKEHISSTTSTDSLTNWLIQNSLINFTHIHT